MILNWIFGNKEENSSGIYKIRLEKDWDVNNLFCDDKKEGLLFRLKY